ncbi:hypothetical protein PFR28_004273 [Salmonella enterica]|uniref:hypothetical protein n=1 Tax=Klebsiella TaxID=570 RepID=UPI000E2E2813|nr:hypothetical protein [Klebsiella pneumoniae]EKI7885384.1 hypothetical protein [Salmonella enterica]HBM2953171.1 hypothetical protein [Klebsiella oxytoca]SYA67814.1 Uncharacterised protein [Klebsiella pneumoniae]HBM3049354.1 hypothetical protein [Klebsiella oxytoca]HBW3630549.1 hypothetical protein [Klebsiella pneumoniae]
MPVPVFRTTDEMIRELQNEGHSVIYERTREYPVVKGVGQIPPAKHLLAPNGHVLAIHVEPRNLWRRRESDDCVSDEPGIENNPFKVKHDVNAPRKIIRRL